MRFGVSQQSFALRQCHSTLPHYFGPNHRVVLHLYSFRWHLPDCLFEPDDADFLKISFEAVSALATAGLTSGILSDITIGSKVVLVLLMYIGRVG